MSQNKLDLYEGMYVISAKLSDDVRHKTLEKIRNGIVSTGGEIVKEHDMGRRKLAYEINDHREGYYQLIYFKANPNAIKELWKEYHLTEDLIRFITLNADKVLEKLEFKFVGEQQ